MVREYVAKITGDISGLEDALKKANGSLKKLNDDEVLIKLNYDGNVKGFNAEFDKILKACPDLTIQFQYNVNQKMLNKELDKLKQLQDLKVDIQTNNASKKISSMISDLENAVKNDMSNDIIEAKIKDIYKYANTIGDLGGKITTKFEDGIYNTLSGTKFEKVLDKIANKTNLSSLKLFNFKGSIDKEITATENRIKDFQDFLSHLETKGASKSGLSSELQDVQEEIKILRSNLEDMKNELGSVNDAKFDELQQNISDTNAKLSDTVEKLKDIQILINHDIPGNINQSRKVAIFDGVKEQIYDVVEDADALEKKLDEMATKMKVPVWQGGDLRHTTVKSSDYRHADSLQFALSRGGNTAGTGEYSTFNLEDVLDWIKNRSDEKPMGLFSLDLGDYNLLQMPSDDYYEGLVDLFGAMHRFVASDLGLKEYDLKELNSPEILFSKYESYFNDFNISLTDFLKFITDEKSFLSNLNPTQSLDEIETISNRFMERFVGVDGISALYTLMDDSVSRGSVIYPKAFNKEHPYAINWGGNYDLARKFFDKVKMKQLETKAANPENDPMEIIENLRPTEVEYEDYIESQNNLIEHLKTIQKNDVTIQSLNREILNNRNSGNTKNRIGQSIGNNINEEEVKETAKETTQKAADALQEAQDSNSPAELTKPLGKDFGLGYAEGIRAAMPDVIDACKEIVLAAYNAVEEASDKSVTETSGNNNFSENFINNLKDSLTDSVPIIKGKIDEIVESLSLSLSTRMNLQKFGQTLIQEIIDGIEPDWVQANFTESIQSLINRVFKNVILDAAIDDLISHIQSSINDKSSDLPFEIRYFDVNTDSIVMQIRDSLENNTFNINVGGTIQELATTLNTSADNVRMSFIDAIEWMKQANEWQKLNVEETHERSMFFNSKTGEFSNPTVIGDSGSVSSRLSDTILLNAGKQGVKYDTDLHWHKDYDYVAPSDLTGDIGYFFQNVFEHGIDKFIIAAQKELAVFDFSKIASNLNELEKFFTDWIEKNIDLVEIEIGEQKPYETFTQYFARFFSTIYNNFSDITESMIIHTNDELEVALNHIFGMGSDSLIDRFNGISMPTNERFETLSKKINNTIGSTYDFKEFSTQVFDNFYDAIIDELHNDNNSLDISDLKTRFSETQINEIADMYDLYIRGLITFDDITKSYPINIGEADNIYRYVNNIFQAVDGEDLLSIEIIKKKLADAIHSQMHDFSELSSFEQDIIDEFTKFIESQFLINDGSSRDIDIAGSAAMKRLIADDTFDVIKDFVAYYSHDEFEKAFGKNLQKGMPSKQYPTFVTLPDDFQQQLQESINESGKYIIKVYGELVDNFKSELQQTIDDFGVYFVEIEGKLIENFRSNLVDDIESFGEPFYIEVGGKLIATFKETLQEIIDSFDPFLIEVKPYMKKGGEIEEVDLPDTNQTPVSTDADASIKQLEQEAVQAEETREQLERLDQERHDDADSQSPGELDALDKLRNAIIEVQKAIDTKTRAFMEEGQVVDGVVQSEITNLETLMGNLIILRETVDGVKSSFNDIGINLDVSLSDDQTKIIEFLKQLAKVKDDKIHEKFDGLKDSIGDFVQTVNALKINSDLFAPINDLLANADRLEALATVLSAGERKMHQANEVINSQQTDQNNEDDWEHALEISNAYAEAARWEQEEAEYLRQRNELLKEGEKQAKAYAKQQKASERENEKAIKEQEKFEQKRTEWARKMSEWLNRNSAAERQFGQAIREMVDTIQKSTTLTNTELDNLISKFKQIQTEAAETGQTGSSLLHMIGQRAKSMIATFTTFNSVYDFVRILRQAFDTVHELDNAFTEMRKVSNETEKTLRSFQKESFDIADTIGSTAQVVQNSTADWLRLGESLEEAKQSAQDASILLNVSEFSSIDEATTALVSMSQAFKDMDKLSIIDKLNNIGNNFNISTDQLATGLQNAAAVLQTQGNNIDQSIALLTAANSITQDISKSSSGLRTIALRISGTEAAKQELQELGEDIDDFVVQTTSKTQETIRAFTAVSSNGGKGIDVLDTNGNLRDTYDILLDISKIYKEIQEEDKKYGTNRANALVEYIAGKNRSNIASSILLNPEQLEAVYKASQDSAGSAMEENEKYLDSLSGHLAKLQNQYQELFFNAMDSDFLKYWIDVGTNILSLVDNVGLLRTAFIGLGTVFGSKFLFSPDSEGGLSFGGKIGTALSTINANKQTTKELSLIQSVFSSWNDKTENAKALNISSIFNGKEIDQLSDKVQQLWDKWTEGGVDAESALADIEVELGELTKGTSEASGVIKNLFSSIGAGILNFGISALVSYLVPEAIKGIDRLINRSKYIQQAAEESRNRIDEINASLKETTDLVDNSKQRYAELAQEVGNLGTIAQNQGTLSNDEYKEFLDISNQLAEKFPVLTKGYDDNGNAIVDLTGDVEGIVGQLNNLVEVEQQLANQKIVEDLDNLWEGYGDEIDDYNKKLQRSQEELASIDKLISNLRPVGQGRFLDVDAKYAKRAVEAAGFTDNKAINIRNKSDVSINWDDLEQKERERLVKAFNSVRQTYVSEIDQYENTVTSKGKEISQYIAKKITGTDIDTIAKKDNNIQRMLDNYLLNYDYDDLWQEYGDDLTGAFDKIMNDLRQYITEDTDLNAFDDVYKKIFAISDDKEIPYADKIQQINNLLLTLSAILNGMPIDTLKELLGLDTVFNSRQDVLDRWTGEKSSTQLVEKGSFLGQSIQIPEEVKNEAYSEYEDFINGLNDEDFNLWQGALNDGNISDELYAKGRQAWEDYLATLQKVADDNQLEIGVKASDAVNSMAEAKSAFNSLESLYNQVVNLTETDGQATGFADPALINSVESAFSKFVTEGEDGAEELNNALENFETTLVEFPNDAEKAQDAIDELVTAYIDQTDIIKNLDKSNAEWSKEQLKAMGITNAEEVVMTRLNKTSKKLSEGLSKVTETLKANAEALQESKQGTQEYETAIKQLAADVAEMLSFQSEDGTISFDASTVVDSSFIEAHRADIDAMVEGDIAALNRVRQAAARAAVMTVSVNVPTEVAEQQINSLMDMVAQADAMNIDVGASIDDSDFINALNNMIHSAGLTAEQVSAAFESMGYDAIITEKKGTMRVVSPDGSGSHVTSIFDGSGGVKTWEPKTYDISIPTVQIVKRKAGGSGQTAHYTPPGNTNTSGGGGGGGGDNNSAEPNKPKEEAEETFDWIEVKLQRLQEAEERLSKVVSNTYDLWSKRNKSLEGEIDNVTEQIKAEEKAQDHYLKYADSIQVNGGKGLNDDDYGENDAEVKANDQRLLEEAIQQFDAYKQKVREGLIGEKDIETIQNHFLSEAISNYKTWYEKSVQAGDAVQDLKIKLGDLAKTRFNNVKSEFDGLISLIEAKAGIVDKRIDKAEARAYFAEEKYYKQLISYNDQIYEKQITEYNKLIEKRDQAVAEGSIKKGSEAWNQMTEEIYNTKQAIIETTNSTIEYQNTLRQLKWDKWDWTQERVSRLADEIEFLNELIANEKMYEEDGQYTDYGQARQGMYLMQYNALIDKLHEYKDEYEEVQKALEKDPGNKTLVERYETLQDVIWDTTKSIEGLQQSIKDHMIEAINTHLQYLDKLIDKYETALDKEKDMFSYQKNIKSQVDNISHLERALNALSGDDSEEARRLRQTTQAELDKAKEQLEETEWDRMISNTKEAIADMRDSYEETLMKGMDNIHEVIERAITEAQANTGKITDCITSTAEQYHYEPSENLQEILDETVTRSDEDYYGVAAEIIKKGSESSWGATSTAQDKNLRDRGFDSERVRELIAEMQKERKYASDMSDAYAGIAYDILTQSAGGKWGKTRDEQIATLTAKGFDGEEINRIINEMLRKHIDDGDTYSDLANAYGLDRKEVNSGKYRTTWYGASLTELGEKYGFDAKKLGEYSKNNYQGGYKDPANYGWELVEDFETAWGENGVVPQKMQEMRNDLTKIIELTQKQLDLENAQIEADIAYERQKQQEQNDTSRVNADAFHAKGSKYIPHKELAVTQEDGSELIFRASDGSMLTPLGQGDMVFSNEMSQRLWEIAKNGVPDSVGTIKPVISGNAGNTINQENAISITLPNVTNYDEFKNALRKDTQFTNFVQEITVGQLAGNNTLRKNRY